MEELEKLAEAKKSGWKMNDIVRWIGILLIAVGAMVLFSSYVYVPLDVWSGGAPWNPATWQYHWGMAYANGWMGVIPLVVGAVMYVAGVMMKPKE
ncbi:hypothetical protein A3K70_03780 [Candidatus Bathyarchaeota archaeon RBG_16_48_13]|nr:MAG: hypothetical protein A3K70_03780 [Candidatus Bathyarchaeota archaeon RBG_16_48_13]